MAVVGTARQHWRGRVGKVDDRSGSEFVRVYWVQVSDLADDEPTVLAASGLPEIGDIYSSGQSDAKCVALECRPNDDNPYIREVVATFSTKEADPSQSQTTDPISRQIRHSFQTVKRMEALLIDEVGNEVVNSAGDRFDPAPEVERSYGKKIFRRNEMSFDESIQETYIDHVNSVSFLGFPSGRVKCTNITAEEQTQNGVNYFEVVYEFETHWNRDGWNQLKILDQGFNKKGPPGGPPTVPIKVLTDLGLERPSDPQNLDGLGAPLAADQPLFFKTFVPFPEADFNALGLY